jgi:hypothetical protein
VEVEIRLCGGGGDAFGRGRWAEWSPDKTVLTFSVRHVLAHPLHFRPSRVSLSVRLRIFCAPPSSHLSVTDFTCQLRICTRHYTDLNP